MCGIYGYIGKESFDSSPILEALHHRGPDAQGSWEVQLSFQKLQFLHTRLSILDLRPTGNQPMVDEITGNVIVYNGEIYNFQELREQLEARGAVFRSDGDTEVLLLAYRIWGEQFLERLDGMFAFLLFDPSQKRLLVARDHIGIKPLYYTQTLGGGWAFSSEIRALMSSGLVLQEWDTQSIHEYLVYGSVQEPRTIRKAIRSFPSAHYAWFELDRKQTEFPALTRYWSLEEFAQSPLDNALNPMHHGEVLQRTVEQQRIADVPVGLFLSAGIDSTVLAECLGSLENHSARSNLTAFTFRLEDANHDESELAAFSAKQLEMKHKIASLSEEMLHSWLMDGFAAMDQPSSDGMNTYLISRAARLNNITVVLSGCGADELHGGYPHYRSLRWLWEGHQKLGKWGRSMFPLVKKAFSLSKDPIFQERLLLLLQQTSPEAMVREKRRFLTPTQIDQIWSGVGIQNFEEHENCSVRETLDATTQIAQAEIQGYLRNTLLRDSDWATMANHQELRVPYLGKRYMETVLGIAWNWKQATSKTNKPLLARHLSLSNQRILQRKKTGFEIAYLQYLKGSLRDQVTMAFSHLNQEWGFKLKADDVDSLSSGMHKQARRYWALLSLGLYLLRHR